MKMHQKKLVTIVTIMLLPIASYANLSGMVNAGFGPAKYNSGTHSSISNMGPVQLNDTIIDGKVEIMGPLKANNVVMGSFDIKGAAFLQNSVVKHDSTIMGYLSARNTVFEGSLIAYTDNMELIGSTIKNITIKKEDKLFAKPPALILKNSVVEEDVVFELSGQQGIIHLCDNSVIVGEVNGATIIESECDSLPETDIDDLFDF